MSNAQLIDMSKLPPPTVVQPLDFETIFAGLKSDLIAAYPAAAGVLELESEPLTIWLQRTAYEVLLLRSRMNDAARAVMLAYATDKDLDHLGAFFGVERLVITPADPSAIPPVEAVMESDEALRERIQLSPQGYTTAGPVGAYVYHARSASGQVLDASATSPSPGQVLVSVLSSTGDGTASAELLATVGAALSAEDVRPITDEVIVQSATIVRYRIKATVYTLYGPDSSTVLSTIDQRIHAYAAAQHRIGRQPTLSGIYAALHIDGVQRVVLESPAADVAIGPTEASWCEEISITYGGTGD